VACLFMLFDKDGLKLLARKIRHYLECRGFLRLSNVPHSNIDFLAADMQANQTCALICQFLLWLSTEQGQGSDSLPEVFSILAPIELSSVNSALAWSISDHHHKVYLGPAEFHWLGQNQPSFASHFRFLGDKGLYDWIQWPVHAPKY